MRTLILIFFLASTAGSVTRAGDHSIHVSLSEIRFNEASSTFEVAIKIFIDDLELALQKDGIKNLGIGTPGEDVLADEHITGYLNQYFTIEIDGAKLKGRFIGKEVTDDLLAVWCYVEYVKDSKQSRKCILSNNILLDIYSDQKNIMDIRMSKSHKDYTIMETGKSSWIYTY